jgi:2-dehydro-3-deoxyphosphogluconate aldolase / (4S)-4-hydroxy-2-oxoglutarate aldolase
VLKLRVLNRIVESGLVAVIRAESADEASRIADACAEGGAAAGAGSVREVVAALECGAEIIKVFPGETLGPAFVRAVKGPLPQAPLMPTGGVSLENVATWIQAGCVAVGVSGNLTSGAKTGDFRSIAERARRFIEEIRRARA